jgi:drug/metabolite transporter (DMT)-like permease
LSLQALPYIVLLGFLFGSTLVVSRFSVSQYAPLNYVGLRLLLAALAHAAIYAISRKRSWSRDPRLWRHAATLGIIGTAIPNSAIVVSLEYQSSGITAVLITTSPAITVLLAHFLLTDEPLTRRKGFGVVVALAGALLLALLGESGLPDVSRADPIGYILVTVAMIFGSGATIYVRKYMESFDPIDVNSVRMLTATAVVMPISLILVGFDVSMVTEKGVAALFYAAFVGTFCGLILAFYNIQRFGATASAMTAYIIPIFAAVGGTLLLGEKITLGMLAGMALILSGVIIINREVSTHDEIGTTGI